MLPSPTLVFVTQTELRDTEEGCDGRIYEMNAECLTDVSVPPFHRKE